MNKMKFMDVDRWIKEEEEQEKKFFRILGENIEYLDKPCINCGRYRVELWTSGNEICDKCGFEQNSKEYYSNEYGTYQYYVL